MSPGRSNDDDEADTRKNLIDNALRLAGWNVHDPSQMVFEHSST